MNLKQLHKPLLLAVCAVLSACNRGIVPVDVPDNGKTPIVLSIGGVDSQNETKAVITDDPHKTYRPFDKDTKIFMVMKSTYDTSNPDFLGSRKDKYTVSRGLVSAGQTNVRFEDGSNQKYWDDAHARSSQLDIWAFAQQANWDNYTFQVPKEDWDGSDPLTEYRGETYYGTTVYHPWWEHTVGVDRGSKGPVYPCIMIWAVTNTPWKQTATSIQYQDLMFSNNLADNSSNGGTDKRLKFGTQVTGKFDGGEMKFYHAMSKITINIIEGDGFDTTSAQKYNDFQFAAGTNIKLTEINTQGTFNIKSGQFEMIDETNGHQPITSIALSSPKGIAPDPYYILQALAIPNIYGINGSTDTYSRFVKDATTTMMEFIIDNNKYQVSSGQLYDALHDNGVPVANATEKTNNGAYIPLEAGKNYVFTFNVGKTKIKNITAKVADWEDVIATEHTPSNAYINVSVKTDEGSAVKGAPSFALYRAPGTLYSGDATVGGYNSYADYNWEKNYEKSSSLAETSSNSGIYTTEWYWPNNNTFYHLRTISPTTAAINGNDATTYINVAGGVIKEDSVTATDYIWGAPFKTTSPTPDNYSFESGYCNNATKANGQLYKAIGATTENITLIQHHMTSQVFVDLETVVGDAAVTIAGATVQLINVAQNAQLYLGNGLITTYSTFGDVTMTEDAHAASSPIPAYDYSYGVLPQPLYNTKAVGVKITTTDGNVYIVDDIRTIKTGENNINEWLPGKKYYYKFVLKKTGITNLSATIVNWETVTADDEPVQIK